MSKDTKIIIIMAVFIFVMAVLAVVAYKVLLSDPDSVRKIVEDNTKTH